MELLPRRVDTYREPEVLEQVRLLYNQAIPELSTRPLEVLSPEDQERWWKKHRGEATLYTYTLIHEEGDGSPIAFLKLHDRGSYVTPLFVIDKRYWGRGLGEQIIAHYLQEAKPKPLKGSQLISNGAICHLNKRMGWQVTFEKNGVQYLYHPNGVDKNMPLEEVNRAYLDYWGS